MISEKDKATILKYEQKYDISTVILFGSGLTKEDPNNIDIDIKEMENTSTVLCGLEGINAFISEKNTRNV